MPQHGWPPDPPPAPRAWVLWWRYHDGSAAELVRVYLDQERARQDLALAEAARGDRVFELAEMPLFGTDGGRA